MDINDIIDSIYKLPDASKEALLSDAPEVAYPKGFHLFRANHKSSKFYLMKKGMLHAYTHQSDKKVTFWFGKEGDAIFPLQTLYDNRAGYENIELLEDSVLYELSVDKLHNLYLGRYTYSQLGTEVCRERIHQIGKAVYIKAIQNFIGEVSGTDIRIFRYTSTCAIGYYSFLFRHLTGQSKQNSCEDKMIF